MTTTSKFRSRLSSRDRLVKTLIIFEGFFLEQPSEYFSIGAICIRKVGLYIICIEKIKILYRFWREISCQNVFPPLKRELFTLTTYFKFLLSTLIRFFFSLLFFHLYQRHFVRSSTLAYYYWLILLTNGNTSFLFFFSFLKWLLKITF